MAVADKLAFGSEKEGNGNRWGELGRVQLPKKVGRRFIYFGSREKPERFHPARMYGTLIGNMVPITKKLEECGLEWETHPKKIKIVPLSGTHYKDTFILGIRSKMSEVYTTPVAIPDKWVVGIKEKTQGDIKCGGEEWPSHMAPADSFSFDEKKEGWMCIFHKEQGDGRCAKCGEVGKHCDSLTIEVPPFPVLERWVCFDWRVKMNLGKWAYCGKPIEIEKLKLYTLDTLFFKELEKMLGIDIPVNKEYLMCPKHVL